MTRVERPNSTVFAALLLVGASVAACGAPVTRASGSPVQTGATTTTGAELVTASPAAPSPLAPLVASTDAEPSPSPGQLVCKTKGLEGTTELFLEWKGDNAKGVLHSVKPSGMVYDQRVTAERGGNGLIIVDEPGSSDLVCHAAVIVQQNGKKHIRLGSGHASHTDAPQPWTDCE